MFRDQFTDFIFNGIPSKNMGVWITNSHDLQETITPELQDSFVAPSLSDGRYYAGTTISKSKITLKCVAINITVQEKRDITKWLNPRVTGRLIFGFDPYHYYNVKVDSAVVATKWIKSRYDSVHGGYLYIYEFTVSFSTVGDWARLGNPLSFDLQYILHRHGEDKESNPYEGMNSDNTKYEEALYNFNNNNNEYNIGILNRSSNIFLAPGFYEWKEISSKLGYGENEWRASVFYFLRNTYDLNVDLTTESLPSIVVSKSAGKFKVLINSGMKDLYPDDIGDSFFEDQQYFQVYYPCIIDAPKDSTVGKKTSSYYENCYSICNPGSYPMYYNYFINGNAYLSPSEKTDPSIPKDGYFYKVILNGEKQYSSEIDPPYEGYFYNVGINSENGMIMNNGDFIQNSKSAQGGITNNNEYYSTGVSTIPVGNAELIDLDKTSQITPKALFRSYNQNGPVNPYNIVTQPTSLSNTVASVQFQVEDSGYYATSLKIADGHGACVTISIADSATEEAWIMNQAGEKKKEIKIAYGMEAEDHTILPLNEWLNFKIIKKSKPEGEGNSSVVATIALTTTSEVLELSPVPSEEPWYSWYYVDFLLPNNFIFDHEGMCNISFYNNKYQYTSEYSVHPENIREEFSQIDAEDKIVNISCYCAPFLKQENDGAVKSYIRCICSAQDFIENFKIENFTDKVVVTRDGVESLENANTSSKTLWVPETTFKLDFNKQYKYVTICNAQRFDLGLFTNVSNDILNENIELQTREA